MRDQAEGLRELAGAVGVAPVADELIMYRRLWLKLKGDLGHEATHHDLVKVKEWGPDHGKIKVKDSAARAQEMLDRMLQMETLARFVRVPTAAPETFESVRKDMAR